MRKTYLKSIYGYEIACCHQLSGTMQTLVVCHGFGSSKESPMVQALLSEMPKHGIDVCSFDFPFHGESRADGKFLRVPCCMTDLRTVEEYILHLSPSTQLIYFGSSFGAYILLLYLSKFPHQGNQAFLRSTAVNMHGILQNWLEYPSLSWQRSPDGDPALDYCSLDVFYGRNFYITRAFLKDLIEFDLFSHYPNADTSSLFMIHGELDSTASAQDATHFAQLSGADLYLIPGAEHRLMGSGELELVLAKLCKWIAKS